MVTDIWSTTFAHDARAEKRYNRKNIVQYPGYSKARVWMNLLTLYPP